MKNSQIVKKDSQRAGSNRGGSRRGSRIGQGSRADLSEHFTRRISFTVNEKLYELQVGNLFGMVEPSNTLAYTLRETLGLTGTKIACDHGACAACTVLADGRPVLSCMMLTVECGGKVITTIEGLADAETGKIDPLQQAFINQTAFQCGFCTPGMIVASKALLNENPLPTEEQVKEALSGHFCRCISHYHVLRAVQEAARGRGETDA